MLPRGGAREGVEKPWSEEEERCRRKVTAEPLLLKIGGVEVSHLLSRPGDKKMYQPFTFIC